MKNQDELLDPAVRKRIIEDIEGTENKRRKNEMYRRYQCYKDQTFRYVQAELIKQFDPSTVNEMSYALSNLALVRKVIDKLARVYKYGVEREVYVDSKKDDELTENVKEITDELDVDRKMKKANRYFKLFKNTLMYIRPVPAGEEDDVKTIRIDPLPPYLYDVVEMKDEREKPIAIILSNYSPSQSRAMGMPLQAIVPGTDGRNGNVVNAYNFPGDGVDQVIADTPGDEKGCEYIFWSAKYHFVCNSKGEIIAGPEDELNPLGELPFVNYAEDQDGSFWAIGGEDLVDGAVLVNSMVTNIMHIGVTQGYGQLVVTGKDIPSQIKVGPNKAIKLNQESTDDPTPTFEYKSANPPLDQLRALVEMYVALLLTTNNLSTSGVQSNLSGGVAFPSGIAMMIDKAESMEDVEDQRQIFVDNEPVVWEKYAKWATLLASKNELTEELAEHLLPEEFDLRIRFGKPAAIESEKERLEVLKLKRDMGIISMVDMMKAEFPGLTDAEAEEKLKEILKEKIERMAIAMRPEGADGGQSGGDNNDGQRDQLQPGAGSERGSEARGGGVPGGADPAERSQPQEPDYG